MGKRSKTDKCVCVCVRLNILDVSYDVIMICGLVLVLSFPAAVHVRSHSYRSCNMPLTAAAAAVPSNLLEMEKVTSGPHTLRPQIIPTLICQSL